MAEQERGLHEETENNVEENEIFIDLTKTRVGYRKTQPNANGDQYTMMSFKHDNKKVTTLTTELSLPTNVTGMTVRNLKQKTSWVSPDGEEITPGADEYQATFVGWEFPKAVTPEQQAELYGKYGVKVYVN